MPSLNIKHYKNDRLFMNKKIYCLILFSTFIFSCEDVITVHVPVAEPRLVIDASINWFKGTSGNKQQIKLTLTAPYFDNEIPPVNNAVVTITDANNITFAFIEEGNSGIYKNSTFRPVINGHYDLTIITNGQTYTAAETLMSVSSIDFVEQKNDGGFSGDQIEIKAFYTDPADEKNFYFFEFINDIPTIPTLEVYDDEFTDGNQIFAFYNEEDLSQGTSLTIRNYGISERFYEFMLILLQQSGNDSGGPFETKPATVRGNCINQTNPENFPFGYFRLSEVDEVEYTIN